MVSWRNFFKNPPADGIVVKVTSRTTNQKLYVISKISALDTSDEGLNYTS